MFEKRKILDRLAKINKMNTKCSEPKNAEDWSVPAFLYLHFFRVFRVFRGSSLPEIAFPTPSPLFSRFFPPRICSSSRKESYNIRKKATQNAQRKPKRNTLAIVLYRSGKTDLQPKEMQTQIGAIAG